MIDGRGVANLDTPEITSENCVRCPTCGWEFFDLVKMFSNDTCIERTLRCKNGGHLRIDRVCLPPAHAL
jgi:hypothetical protein